MTAGEIPVMVTVEGVPETSGAEPITICAPVRAVAPQPFGGTLRAGALAMPFIPPSKPLGQPQGREFLQLFAVS